MLIKRWMMSTVPAAAVTVGIGLFIVGMIRAEFIPQDKTQAGVFEINPEVEEPPVVTRIKNPPKIKTVETPPPPPVIERTQATQPSETLTRLDGAIPIFEPADLKHNVPIIVVADTNAQPLVRIAPIMPLNAQRSGHCNVRFNVSAEGAPYDVTATYCTQSLFERATVKSVSRWKFKPKIVNGRAVAMRGVENKVSYRLTDERGRVIPE